ncbi:Nonspecific lipid-transfer protein B, putative [Ricinus communis]|uniref:Non-specific lipid-transfer protein n=1 Tax=Ricinus communis TaxID=3988 RepID=B9SMA6_RICCO|nr:Nonspecific lipid-transfer protein B, putative [Ricinus communis]
MKGIIISVLGVTVIMVQLMAMQGVAIDCAQVNLLLGTCMPYLIGFDSSPSLACCAGVRNLKRLAPTTADRRVACDCVKAAAARHPNIRDDAASTLPNKCGVDFNIPVSNTTKCQE